MKSKKAISLIVLIITIIVMIILASAIIMSLDNANIFNKAEEAVDKTNAATQKYVDEIMLAERKLENMSEAVKVTDKIPGTLSGKGTTDDPYLIESIEDLVAFSEAVNAGTTYEGKTVKLVRKLDFNSDNSYANPKSGLKEQMTAGNGFVPIGNCYKQFKGTFDGDYYEVQNLNINLGEDNELRDVGFFGVIENATVKNIGITGNIKVEGTDFDTCVGGLIGSMWKSCELINCYNKANIQTYADGNVGGIVGQGEFIGKENICHMYNCYNEGSIISGARFVGGLCASTGQTQVDRCYNKGLIKIIELNNVTEGIGGLFFTLVGENSSIKNSYNEGKIIAGESAYTSGLVEAFEGNIVENSYNAGDIVFYGELGFWGVGLIGYVKGTINNMFNIGKIEGEFEGKYEVSNEVHGTIENIYCTNTNVTIDTGDYIGTPTIKTLEKIKSQEFVNTLNRNIEGRDDLVKWKLGPNGYPTLDI